MILEYQAKNLLRKYAVPLLPGTLVDENAVPFAPCVLKVQIARGGRGKAGGIVISQTVADATTQLVELRSKKYYGLEPEAIYAEKPVDVAREIYLALRFDRDQGRTILLAHRQGGVDIEQVSQDEPPLAQALDELNIAELAAYLQLDRAQLEPLVDSLRQAYDQEDLLLLEINPLAQTTSGELVCLDAKITLDVAARFRHDDWPSSSNSANFVIINPAGQVGTAANGAGLAMATTDALQAAGLEPYNFYDVGGGLAGEEFATRLSELARAGVRTIVINIFGGITQCDEIAQQLLATRQQMALPRLMVRLAGTKAPEGQSILRAAGVEVFASLEEIIAQLQGRDRSGFTASRSRTDDNILPLPAKRRVLVQGITGKHGRFHTKRMLGYGTQIVAGVTPGKSGENVAGVPVFDSVSAALASQAIDVAICFVPAKFAAAALHEAIAAGVPEIICITEGIPVRDMVEVLRAAREKGVKILGPNTPGLIIPGVELLGIIAPENCQPGRVGVVSRSGTLTYEVAAALSARGIGQREVVGIGGDMLRGSGFVDILQRFQADEAVERIVLIGEIGGQDEHQAAEFIAQHINKPTYAFVAGESAPAETQLGHAGAIVGGAGETAAAKQAALRGAGVAVARSIEELVEQVARGVG